MLDFLRKLGCPKKPKEPKTRGGIRYSTYCRGVWNLISICVAAALLGGCKNRDNDGSQTRPSPEPRAKATLDLHDPSSCVACHPVIHREYSESMHARSHQKRDPIFAGVRAIRIKKEGPGIAKACARCHSPDAAAKPALNAGVTCFTCHNLRANAPAKTFIGPHTLDAGASAAHKLGPATAAFKDGRTLCLSCHDALKSPKGIAMCTTGPEHASMPARGSKTCVDCHMPRVAGPATIGKNRADHASHAFLGPHRAWYQNDPAFLATAVTLKATLTPGKLTLSVRNDSGHDFPTGFPGRLAVLSCRGLDATGKHTWTCAPIRFGKKYVDAADKPTLAPYAAKLASDTRLKGGATKTIVQTPPKTVVRVEVGLSMRLLPPPLAKKLKLSKSIESQPRRIAGAVATVAPTK